MTNNNLFNEEYMIALFKNEYNYNPNDISTDFQLNEEIVDIAIFYHKKPHMISNCWLIGFINRPEESFNLEQLKTLLFSSQNLEYCIWLTDIKTKYYKKENDMIKEVFNIPQQGKSLDLPKRNELKPIYELEKRFHIIHNHIYANEGYSTIEAFNELLKLLFLKIYDEKYPKGEYVRFGINEIEYNEILEGKKTQFENRIKVLFEDMKGQFKEIFDEYDIIKLKDSTLAFIIGQLENYNLSASNRDIKGAAFQKFLFSHQRGSRGQFLTPEPIITLAVKMVRPKSSEKILDPACGTAGFLNEALKYIRKKEFGLLDNDDLKLKKERNFITQNLFGMDINPTILKVAKMRLILEDAGDSKLILTNSLSKFSDIKNYLDSNQEEDSIQRNSFDIIMTNPPFGTQGKIKTKPILKQYQLAHKWKSVNNRLQPTDKLSASQVPEVLFIERCIDFLKENGRLAIILPLSIIQNITQDYVRRYILKRAKLLAIISLPNETFIPFGTGIKAILLIIQKMNSHELKKEIEKDYKIFFSILESIGYEGNKNGTPIYVKDNLGNNIIDENGNFIVYEDTSFVLSAFNNFHMEGLNDQSSKAFIIKYSELEDRLDPEYYQPKLKKLRSFLIKSGALPLSSYVKIVTNKSRFLKQKERLVKYIEINNINSKTSEIHSFSEMQVHELPSRASYDIKKGDIITAVSGISTGTSKHATAFISEEYEGCICTNGFRVLRPQNIDPYYLLAYLKTDFFLHQMLQFRTGSAIPAVNNKDLKNVLVLPPSSMHEQEIAEKIKKSLDLRKKSRLEMKNAIEFLKEFALEEKLTEEKNKVDTKSNIKQWL